MYGKNDRPGDVIVRYQQFTQKEPMDQFLVTFPVSNVQTWVFLPPLVAFVVSFFTSMGGVSGAFLLLPFQVSVLGFSAPAVSATNQFYNILAIPGGVWTFIREKRMVWPLAWVVVFGTLPGVFLGAWIRIVYLPDPQHFKFFAGLVLGYIGIRLLLTIIRDWRRKKMIAASTQTAAGKMEIKEVRFSLARVSFSFSEATYSFSVPATVLLCFFVGAIGGIYGIGGGAIIAPFLVAFFELPVYAVAGAALLGTFITSVAGVIFYQALAQYYPHLSVAPDLLLGVMFGLGGLLGIYCGARCQKYMPASLIKLILCFCILFVAGTYVQSFFASIP